LIIKNIPAAYIKAAHFDNTYGLLNIQFIAQIKKFPNKTSQIISTFSFDSILHQDLKFWTP